MVGYVLRKSEIESSFWEVLKSGEVVREVQISFPLKKIPPFFNTLEEIDPWLQKEEYRLAKAYAYRLLNMRSYSKKKLFQKLELKKYSSEISAKIIQEIDALGYLPDKELAQSIARQKETQGYGERYIKQYLREKGLDSHTLEFDDVKAIEKWVLKLKGKEKSKVIPFLLRKGFSLDLIKVHF